MLVDTFGCRWTLDVRGLGDDLADSVEHLWERTRVAAGPPAGDDEQAPPFVVTRGDDGAVRIDGSRRPVADDDLPYALSRAVTLASIERRTGECLMLHAAGLAAEDGSTVALVAASGTGKTTAAAALGTGLGYVSDETVAIEHDLSVRAYAKPLSVVVDPTRRFVKHERSPDDLGLLRAPADLRLAATVVMERDPSLRAPELEPLGLVEAVELTLPQTSALTRLDRPLDRLARALTAGHGPWRLRYAEVTECADLVAELAAGRAPGGDPGPAPWTWVDGRGLPDPGPGTSADPGTGAPVRRARFDDAVVADGVVLVLRDRVPVTLPGLAATVWLRSEHPAPLDELVAAATAELGPHPDARQLVVATVRELRDAGLVVLG